MGTRKVGGGIDREGVWDSAFGVDGREVFAAIRIYAAEAV